MWTEEDEFVECVGLYDSFQHLENLRRHSPPQASPALDNHLSSNHHVTTLRLPYSQASIQENPILQQMLQTHEPVVIGNVSHSLSDVQGFDLPLKMPAQ